MYEATKKQNEKVVGLDTQMVQVETDFEEMMRVRNEAKRQLEIKFKDVYQKIKDVRQYTADEGQKVNENLKGYQAKFEKQLKSLYKNLDENFKTESSYQQNEIKRGYDRMQELEDRCAKERSDRISSLEDQLNPLRNQMDINRHGLTEERNNRVASERVILDGLKNDASKIADAINQEKAERQDQQGELVEKLNTELERQRNKIERIKGDSMAEFTKDRGDVNKEMGNRFSHQDETIGHISHFISTFQNTLKAVGEQPASAPGKNTSPVK